jgi:hypothetical protein
VVLLVEGANADLVELAAALAETQRSDTLRVMLRIEETRP